MLRYIFLLLLFCGLFSIGALAQSSQHITTADQSGTDRDSMREPVQEPQQEMLKEIEIKRAEGTHKQNIERAKESAQLSAELRDTYEQHKALDPAGLKKLGRMEKLTRQLRGAAGGGDGEAQLKDPPADLVATLARMAELADELRKCVEKTPRQVVSVSVIAQTNELLELIRHARNLTQ